MIDNGKKPEVKTRKHRLLTFRQVADIMVSEWQGKREQGKLSDSTVEGYVGRVDVLNRRFGAKLLCEISDVDIKSYLKYTLDKFSPVTSNRYLFIIKQVFKQGLKENTIVADPSESFRYASEKKHERNSFILPGEINALIAASQKSRAKFYMPALIFLGAEHATSRQEALSLKWKDINFDFEDIGLIRFYRTKNKRERTEHLMPRTKQALLDWQAHLEHMRRKNKIDLVDTSWVFCRLNGKPITRFDTAWRRVCHIAGIKNFHYHDLRHTFCSNLILSGGDLKDAKEMIGHSDIAMTDRYSHLPIAYKRRLQTNLAEHYSNPQN
jgi:integrase